MEFGLSKRTVRFIKYHYIHFTQNKIKMQPFYRIFENTFRNFCKKFLSILNLSCRKADNKMNCTKNVTVIELQFRNINVIIIFKVKMGD